MAQQQTAVSYSAGASGPRTSLLETGTLGTELPDSSHVFDIGGRNWVYQFFYGFVIMVRALCDCHCKWRLMKHCFLALVVQVLAIVVSVGIVLLILLYGAGVQLAELPHQHIHGATFLLLMSGYFLVIVPLLQIGQVEVAKMCCGRLAAATERMELGYTFPGSCCDIFGMVLGFIETLLLALLMYVGVAILALLNSIVGIGTIIFIVGTLVVQAWFTALGLSDNSFGSHGLALHHKVFVVVRYPVFCGFGLAANIMTAVPVLGLLVAPVGTIAGSKLFW